MNPDVPKIASYDQFLVWCSSVPTYARAYVNKEMTTINRAYVVSPGLSDLPFVPGVLPNTLPSDTSIFPDQPEANWWWMCREAKRLELGIYMPLNKAIRTAIASLQGPDYCHCFRYWWHFAHESKTDSTMIAYTPSSQYGEQDRQIVMKAGRYLKKFFGDVFDDETIRHLANNSHNFQIQWAHGGEIAEVYAADHENCGSCMTGDWDDEPYNPLDGYAYQYPNGQYEFALAYITRNDVLTARALCALRDKLWVRHYGNDGPALVAMLEEQHGYQSVSSLEGRGLRLKYQVEGDRFYAPYLDGDGKIVSGPFHDEKGKSYLEWVDRPNREINMRLDSASGVYWRAPACECGHCGENVDEDSTSYSEYHAMEICSYCIDHEFSYAYYGRHNDRTYVLTDDTILCNNTDDRYVDNDGVLDYHDIGCTSNDEYYPKDGLITLLNDDVVHQDDALGVGEDEYGTPVYVEHADVDATYWIYKPLTRQLRFIHPDYLPSDFPDWDEDDNHAALREYGFKPLPEAFQMYRSDIVAVLGDASYQVLRRLEQDYPEQPQLPFPLPAASAPQLSAAT